MNKNPTPPNKKIVCNLDVLMPARGLSPEKLSDMSGVSRPTIYKLRANRGAATMVTLTKLANALHVTHVELLRTVEK